MPVQPVEYIWMNGSLVKWSDAQIHILSHVIHYGSSWFEGIRCYETARGSAIFRFEEHLRRLYDSARMYRATIPYTPDQLIAATKELIHANKMKSCYIRPLAYRGYGDVGVNPFPCPVDVAIAVWDWGAYLGGGALERGIDVCVSSWQRSAPNTLPTMAKSGGNYLNSQLIKMEALVDGYAEGIALDINGHLSEGSGENIFLIRDNILYTPPLTSALLPGITRLSAMTLAKELGYELREMNIPREMLYVVDEIFFTGTAAEITPVRSVDKLPVGSGEPGPITRRIQQAFFEIVRSGKDSHSWLHFL